MSFCERYLTRKCHAIEAYVDFVLFQARLDRAIIIIGLKHDLLDTTQASACEGNVTVCSIAGNRNPREAALIFDPDFDVESVTDKVCGLNVINFEHILTCIPFKLKLCRDRSRALILGSEDAQRADGHLVRLTTETSEVCFNHHVLARQVAPNLSSIVPTLTNR